MYPWSLDTQVAPDFFSLCVDNFGVKYIGKTHADHLMSALQAHYKISSDWSGKRYLVFDLDWDYAQRKFHLSVLS